MGGGGQDSLVAWVSGHGGQGFVHVGFEVGGDNPAGSGGLLQ